MKRSAPAWFVSAIQGSLVPPCLHPITPSMTSSSPMASQSRITSGGPEPPSGTARCVRKSTLFAIDEVDASELPRDAFLRDYMAPGKPVLIRGAATGWRVWDEWRVTGSGEPDVAKIAAQFGDCIAPVATCAPLPDTCSASDGSGAGYGEQEVVEKPVGDFVAAWRRGDAAQKDAAKPPQYLKDWHMVRDARLLARGGGAGGAGGCAGGDDQPPFYRVPAGLADDWLNGWWDAKASTDAAANDYRFCYVGEAGSWTPLHRDVFCSHSWSANVSGRKLWVVFPPSQRANLHDRYGRLVVPDARAAAEELDAARWPGWAEACRHRVALVQRPGDLLFMPSGHWHQVHNLEACLSINHNSINAHNLAMVWATLADDLSQVREAISDCKEGDDADLQWEAECQKLLDANSGVGVPELVRMLRWRAAALAGQLGDAAECPPDADFEPYDAPRARMPTWVLRKGLTEIARVLEAVAADRVALLLRRDDADWDDALPAKLRAMAEP